MTDLERLSILFQPADVGVTNYAAFTALVADLQAQSVIDLPASTPAQQFSKVKADLLGLQIRQVMRLPTQRRLGDVTNTYAATGVLLGQLQRDYLAAMQDAGLGQTKTTQPRSVTLDVVAGL